MRLTACRQEILSLLCEHSYLKTSHFYKLLSKGKPSERATRRTLHDFWQRGYLYRAGLTDFELVNGFPHYENIYWLSRSGHDAAVRLGLGNVKYSETKFPRTLDHEIAITEFHLKLQDACRSKGAELQWRQKDLKKTINPDAYFNITNNDGTTLHYFLEIERSKQGHYKDGKSGLMVKCEKYYRYQRSDECKQDWKDFSQFHVVIVVKNDERRKNLLKALKETMPTKTFCVAIETDPLTCLTPKDFDKGATYSLV